MRLLVLAGVLTITGCSAIDRPAMSDFDITGENSFLYTTKADVVYKVNNVKAEQKRMEWLEMYLKDNSFCQNGYKIEERRVIILTKGVLSDISKITYQGHCK